MARPAHQGCVSPNAVIIDGLTYSEATVQDDLAIRNILTQTPMQGWLSLSMQREPSYFLGSSVSGDAHQTVIVREPEQQQAVGMFSRSVYRAYVNGQEQNLGYLGGLRVVPSFRHKLRRLKHGFEALRALLDEPVKTPFYLTSIVQDNHVARRILSANLAGMPRYQRCGELTTMSMTTSTKLRRVDRSIQVATASDADIPEIAACLQRNYVRYQFAPVWDVQTLRNAERCRNLQARDFLVVRDRSRIIGCVALWDQRPFKQIVVHGYRHWLHRMRPVLNLISPLTGWPRLPSVGESLKQIFLAHLAVDDDQEDVARALIAHALQQARRRDVNLVNLGMSVNHPLYSAFAQNARMREYRSELYTVSLGGDDIPVQLDDRVAHVEVAML